MNVFEVFEWKLTDHEPICIFVKGLGDLRREQGLSFFPYVHILSKGQQ